MAPPESVPAADSQSRAHSLGSRRVRVGRRCWSHVRLRHRVAVPLRIRPALTHRTRFAASRLGPVRYHGSISQVPVAGQRTADDRIAQMPRPRSSLVFLSILATLVGVATAQAPDRGRSLTLLSRDGQRSLAVTVVNGRQMVALHDLASIFDLTVRDDALAEGVTVSYQGTVTVLSATQNLVSVSGRLVSLPSPPIQEGGGWLVPIEFISRALSVILDTPFQVRRPSGLVIVGDLRVPQIEVGYARAGDQARVTFDMTPAAPYAIDREPGRLLVKFDADRLDVTLPDAVSGTLVAGIRTVEQPTWIAIDLGPDFGSARSSVVTGSAGSTRLVVNVLSDAAPATSVARADTPPRVPAPAPPRRDAAPPPLELAPVATVRTIVIDPGHGGGDVGTQGASGVLEKDVTLQVARRLKQTIESRLGLRVVLTRNDDGMVRLDERAAIANNNKADLFISLHVNASVSQDASGAEVYYLSLDEYSDEARLAGSAQRAVPVVGGGTRDIEVVLWEMAQVRHVDQSAVFADIVDEELRRRLAMSRRDVQQAPFRVLVGANMPAVLVEMGFVSNPADEHRLASGAFQNSLAQALFQSVARYRARLQEQAEAARRAADRSPAGERP